LRSEEHANAWPDLLAGLRGARLVTWDRGGHLAFGHHLEVGEAIHTLLHTTAT
jgi:hypothetical protein